MSQKVNLSRRVTSIKEYVFSQLARDIKIIEEKTSKKVLNFGPGTPDVPPNSKIINKLNGFNQLPSAHLYPGYGAIPEFNKSLIDHYKSRFGVQLDPSELLPLLGGKDGVVHLPFVVADKGDEILVPNPGYPAYSGSMELFGIKATPYTLSESNFQHTLDNIKRMINHKTKAIWVNFPSNPTGQVATVSELAQIVDLARQNHIIILFDNAYSEITFDGYVAPSILQVPNAKEVCVEIGSFSKSFSLAGFRIGWAVGNSQIIANLGKFKSQLDSGLSIPLQKLGAFALDHNDHDWHNQMINSYKSRRDIIAQKLINHGLTFSIPKGSLYIWAKIPDKCPDSITFCREMLNQNHVLFTPGTAFGTQGERHIRVSICINISSIEDYL